MVREGLYVKVYVYYINKKDVRWGLITPFNSPQFIFNPNSNYHGIRATTALIIFLISKPQFTLSLPPSILAVNQLTPTHHQVVKPN